jgi:hypothetical protein
MRDRQEIFAYGYPPYEYVPLAGIAQQPRSQRVDMTSAFREPLGRRRGAPVPAMAASAAAPLPGTTTPPPAIAATTPSAMSQPALTTSVVASSGAPASTPPIPAPAAATGGAVAASPVPAASPVADTLTAGTAVAPPSSDRARAGREAEPAGVPAPPIGSNGGGGHYDLPHAAVAHAAPTRAQPVAKPVVIASADARPPTAARSVARHEETSVDDEPRVRRRHDADRTPDAASDDTGSGSRRRGGHDADTSATSTRRKDSHSSRGKAADAARDDQDRPDAAAPETKHRGERGTAEARHDDSPAKTRRGDRDDARHGRREARDEEADEPDTKASSRSSHGSRHSNDDEPSGKGKSGAARVYVQIAGGANRSDLGKALAGVRRQAPELMKGKAASTTALKATNRLLVGPFKDEDEAQGFVNKAAGKGVSAFVFKSAKGQKIDRLDAE